MPQNIIIDLIYYSIHNNISVNNIFNNYNVIIMKECDDNCFEIIIINELLITESYDDLDKFYNDFLKKWYGCSTKLYYAHDFETIFFSAFCSGNIKTCSWLYKIFDEIKSLKFKHNTRSNLENLIASNSFSLFIL